MIMFDLVDLGYADIVLRLLYSMADEVVILQLQLKLITPPLEPYLWPDTAAAVATEESRVIGKSVNVGKKTRQVTT